MLNGATLSMEDVKKINDSPLSLPSFAAPEFSGAEVKDEHGMDIVCLECRRCENKEKDGVFRCDVRRRTLSIIPTTATKCPLLYVRLSRLNLICRPGSAAPPSPFYAPLKN